MGKDLKIIVDWEVPQKIIFNALLDKMEIMKYTRGPAEMDRVNGGKFAFYDGKIQGTNTVIDEEKFEIEQQWKFREWDNFSTVKFTFKDRDDECQMIMNQTNIPDNADIAQLEAGWQNQIIKPMSQICGFGIDE